MNQPTLRARRVAGMPVRTGLVLLAVLGLQLIACSRQVAPDLEAGRQLYLTQGCTICHGAGGRGDGPGAVNLGTRPRDFHDPVSFRAGHTLEAIARTLGDGLTHPASQMPAFPHLSETERRHLAAYVLSLAP